MKRNFRTIDWLKSYLAFTSSELKFRRRSVFFYLPNLREYLGFLRRKKICLRIILFAVLHDEIHKSLHPEIKVKYFLSCFQINDKCLGTAKGKFALGTAQMNVFLKNKSKENVPQNMKFSTQPASTFQ